MSFRTYYYISTQELNEDIAEYTTIGKLYGYDIKRNIHLNDIRDGEKFSRGYNVSDTKLMTLISKAYKQNGYNFDTGITHIFYKNKNSNINDLIIFVSKKDHDIHVKTVLQHGRKSVEKYFIRTNDKSVVLEKFEDYYHYFIFIEED